ncbi:MAG: iron-sulfur cluster assembly accessory protein [Nostocales cyanobacterium 94392]|nr:iron-sulfur cluster assembly accessory protein [Nostocales cyanobacterium 94392]
MTISLTEKAAQRLSSFLQETATDKNQKAKGVRVSVKDGGCNGYEYAMNITSKLSDDDLVVQQHDITIYVDAKSAPLLQGMVIDFIEGMMESGFKFTNPNATDTCGCGKSFQAGDCTPDGVPCNQ